MIRLTVVFNCWVCFIIWGVMAILLTGATGFVGQNVHSRSESRCVVRNKNKFFFDDFFEIENFDEDTIWDDAFIGIDSVVHLAALAHCNSYSKDDYWSVNVGGTLRLAREAANFGVKRFVFVSSIGVLGRDSGLKPFSSYSSSQPHNYYTESKLAAELGLRQISEETNMELVVIRPTLVYGANAPGNFGVLTKLISKMPISPFGLVQNRRDFVSVQNLADLILTCASHPDAGGNTFLASDGETVSIKEFTDAIAIGLGKKLIQLPVPVSLMYLAARLVGKVTMAEQLLGNLEVDSSNAQDVLGWVPPYTMEQAMASLSESKK